MLNLNAHYATNVYHYHYAVRALKSVYGEVSLSRRFQLTAETLQSFGVLASNRTLARLLSRRVVEPDEADTTQVLWPVSIWPALRTRVGGRLTAWEVRNIASLSSRAVAHAAKRADVFQFVEGLGRDRLQLGNLQLSVMERRNLHHEVFEEAIEPWGGFPARFAPDPLRDILEEEYATADHIVVYSDVARQSFIERGFSPERVHTVGLGVSAGVFERQPPAAAPDPHLAIYVGRGDIYKGIDVAVGAVEALGKPFRLEVAGPFPPDAVRWLARFPFVTYLGTLGRSELLNLYARASILLSPSVESFGLAMTEAANAGVQLVVGDKSGVGPSLGPTVAQVVAGRGVKAWAETLAEAFASENAESRVARSQQMETLVQNTLGWEWSEAKLAALHGEALDPKPSL